MFLLIAFLLLSASLGMGYVVAINLVQQRENCPGFSESIDLLGSAASCSWGGEINSYFVYIMTGVLGLLIFSLAMSLVFFILWMKDRRSQKLQTTGTAV